ncbi:MAG TPA: hypothetical protein VFF43_10285 [Caldimonas sp.]|nr:hypothetical protein [Caldimonas sp.]
MSAARTVALVVAAALATAGASAQVAAGAASAPAAPSSPAKKALVQRILTLQQGEIEALARNVVERPAAQMMQEAGLAIQQQIPPERREATGRAIEAEVKKYVDEAYPPVRDRAVKLAPSTIGAVLEAKMSEDELRTLLAWLDSPTNKKYQQIAVDMRTSFFQKLLADMPALLDPKLQALNGRIRVILGLPAVPSAMPAPPARPASK